jgi:hypothetical protein
MHILGLVAVGRLVVCARVCDIGASSLQALTGTASQTVELAQTGDTGPSVLTEAVMYLT